MTRLLIGCAAAAILLAAGCGPVSTFTVRDNACPARPEGCEVAVITSRPSMEYVVMGVLDIEAFSIKRVPSDEESFRALVSPEVCAAGGDAVIPGITGDGRYIQATVVKWVEAGATGPACEPPEPDADAEDGDDAAAEAAETAEADEADEADEAEEPADDEEPAPPDDAVEEAAPADESTAGEPPAEESAESEAPAAEDGEAPAEDTEPSAPPPVSSLTPGSRIDLRGGTPC